MKIWLDLANSPQVLFFIPILEILTERGHNVIVTSRKYAQTTQLIDRFNIPHKIIGRHGGNGFLRLAGELSRRSLQLMSWARNQHFDLALSHNSYAQITAAAVLHLPTITLMDYEHQPLNHIGFRLANSVIVPQVFPKSAIKKYGASEKVVTYPGLKEQVYLSDFLPERNYRSIEGLPVDKCLVVVRPPATWTAYHRYENDLFEKVLEHLVNDTRFHILLIPRMMSQVSQGFKINKSNLQIAQKVYHGPDLIYAADLVISGGGTMNREAAILGTPAISVFRGKSCAVDEWLVQKDRLVMVLNDSDIDKIRISEQNKRQSIMKNVRLKENLVDQILAFN